MAPIRYYLVDSDYRVIGPVGAQEWLRFQSREDRIWVAVDIVSDEVKVSTRFFGIDSGWGPNLFETMILGGPHDRSCWRTRSWDGAVVMHREVVDRLRDGFELPPGRLS